MTKSAIIDPAVADAAFALKAGEVSAPVQGKFGVVIITVLSVEPGDTKPFSVVAPIHQERHRARTRQKQSSGPSRQDRGCARRRRYARRRGEKLELHAVTLDIDRSGRDPSGKFAAAIPAATTVISGAFSTDVGVDTYPVDADGGYVWYEVEAVTPARDRTLDEVKTEVEAALAR